jgi:catechol 2,3-dioxygenase-like lactoylglutathione lyase family enzyme
MLLGPAIGVRAIIHSVTDLEKTVKFYQEGLGMVPVGPSGKPLTAMPAPHALDESLSKFTDTHGAKFRNASFNIPGATFMLVLFEFTDTPRKQATPHMQDPGAATLVLTVRDVDAALDGVKKNGGSVLSIGGQPMKIGGEKSLSRSVFVRDPASLIDAEGAQWRISSAKVPGTSVDWELLEFKGVARKPFKLRVPDPGSPAVSVNVKDVEAAMKSVADGGGSIVTAGGEPVKLGGGGVFVRDPNGLLIELIP